MWLSSSSTDSSPHSTSPSFQSVSKSQVVNKRAIVDTFDELDKTMDTADQKVAVCQVRFPLVDRDTLSSTN